MECPLCGNIYKSLIVRGQLMCVDCALKAWEKDNMQTKEDMKRIMENRIK